MDPYIKLHEDLTGDDLYDPDDDELNDFTLPSDDESPSFVSEELGEDEDPSDDPNA